MPTTKRPTRAARWSAAVIAARSACDSARNAADALSEALEALRDVQSEYQEWRDGMPENLEASPTAQLLDAIVGVDLDVSIDLGDIEAVIDEAEGCELPRGFGRD